MGVEPRGCRDRGSRGWDMGSQQCGGLGSPRYRYMVPGDRYRYKGPKVQVHGALREWGPGLREAGSRGCRVPGHGIPSVEDPGHSRAWTHRSRAHGVWATAGPRPGLWDTGPWEAADGPCPGTRGGDTPPCPPRPGPAWPMPVPGLPLPAPGAGAGRGLALPCGRHTCAHTCLLLNLGSRVSPESDICLQPFPLTATCQVWAIEERGDGHGVGPALSPALSPALPTVLHLGPKMHVYR